MSEIIGGVKKGEWAAVLDRDGHWHADDPTVQTMMRDLYAPVDRPALGDPLVDAIHRAARGLEAEPSVFVPQAEPDEETQF